MRKILFYLLTISSSSIFALTTVDFSKSSYTCNKLPLGTQSQESDLLNNCHYAVIIEHEENIAGRVYRGPGGGTQTTQMNTTSDDEVNYDKIKFFTDDHSYMVCYYKSYKLIKCKVRPPKVNKSTSSEEINSTTRQDTLQESQQKH
jgi:hypothetical protein